MQSHQTNHRGSTRRVRFFDEKRNPVRGLQSVGHQTPSGLRSGNARQRHSDRETEPSHRLQFVHPADLLAQDQHGDLQEVRRGDG